MALSRVLLLLVLGAMTGCVSTHGATMADCVRGFHNPAGDTSRCVPSTVTSTSPKLALRRGAVDGTSAIPAAVLRACGRPGTRVVLTVAPLTIPRSLCDLAGVTLVYNRIGVTVPRERGGGAVTHADGPAGSSTTEASVDQATGDVTFRVARS